ncbi:HGxxPAAW family protein [Pseudokineococcus sp. 1T1Z-3]|uniref:HGxxPAAW family protein n=1 Tax=Pseudokineococcus sp. 1T1Z-3 TaxID=3132745 RepID=UPI0030A4AA6D
MAQQERVESTERDAGQQRGPVLPPHTEDHGHSVAAWTAVTICLVGALVASLGVVFLVWWVFWVGMAVFALVGPLVGRVLSAMGRGAVKVEQSSDHPSDEPHDIDGRGEQKPGARAGGSGPDAGTATDPGTR